METAILTGGTGFVGINLLKYLIKNNVFVYVIVRKNSKRLYRLRELQNIKIIHLDMYNMDRLHQYIKVDIDTFYHLAWEGGRYNYYNQLDNVYNSLQCMYAAKKLNVKQFICIGSQAEYGIHNSIITEETKCNPINAYGACKLSTYHMLKSLSEQLDINFAWIRLFSAYGQYDNPNTLISYIFNCFKNNVSPILDSCYKYWEFIHVDDVSEALYLAGIKNISGLYNLSSGKSDILANFINEMKDIINTDIKIEFGSGLKDNTELDTDINKIKKELNWIPKINFRSGIIELQAINN